MESTHQQKRKIDWARYIVSLIITAAVFGTVFYISNIANAKRLAELRSIQDKMAIDLLSSETQFSLLSQASCSQDGNSILAPEIGEIGDRLSFMEEQLGADDADVIGLKKYYSLLQIKDYMLMKELREQCNFKPITILYFYSNQECDDCIKQGYALTALRKKYPDLRVYSFDANLDLSAIKTLQTVSKVPAAVPSLVINGKVFTGYMTIEAIEKADPSLAKMAAAEAKKQNAAKAQTTSTQ